MAQLDAKHVLSIHVQVRRSGIQCGTGSDIKAIVGSEKRSEGPRNLLSLASRHLIILGHRNSTYFVEESGQRLGQWMIDDHLFVSEGQLNLVSLLLFIRLVF